MKIFSRNRFLVIHKMPNKVGGDHHFESQKEFYYATQN